MLTGRHRQGCHFRLGRDCACHVSPHIQNPPRPTYLHQAIQPGAVCCCSRPDAVGSLQMMMFKHCHQQALEAALPLLVACSLVEHPAALSSAVFAVIRVIIRFDFALLLNLERLLVSADQVPSAQTLPQSMAMALLVYVQRNVWYKCQSIQVWLVKSRLQDCVLQALG